MSQPLPSTVPSTNITLDDLFPAAELEEAIRAGLVREQISPDGWCAILNYTEAAQFSGTWNRVTLACRGLIYHRRTRRVVARPFPKFFNYGQPGAPVLDLSEQVDVVDKLDGSLGIFFPIGFGNYGVATRGSFTSDQACHATELYQSRYYPRFTPPPGWTVLAEIVYPGNRIVCDYGAVDDLVLLGAVHIASGRVVGPDSQWLSHWTGPRANILGRMTVAEALALPPRVGAEGFVLRTAGNTMMKVKQADYVALHRIVTGLNERAVWEMLVANKPIDEFIAELPDEFHDWVTDVAARLYGQYMQILARVSVQYNKVVEQVFGSLVFAEISRDDRARFAAAAKEVVAPDDLGYLFSMLDGKEITPKIWARIRPAGNRGVLGRAVAEEAE